MPILFLYLQALIKDNIEKVEKKIKNIFKNITFIPVISKDIKSTDDVITRKKGLKQLKEKTLFKFIESIDYASFIHIKNKFRDRFTKKVDSLGASKKVNNIQKCINKLFQNLIGKNDLKSIKSIRESVGKIINNFNNYDFNEEILNYIEIFKSTLIEKGLGGEEDEYRENK